MKKENLVAKVITIYPDQLRKLDKIANYLTEKNNSVRKVSRSEIVREAIEAYFKNYSKILKES